MTISVSNSTHAPVTVGVQPATNQSAATAKPQPQAQATAAPRPVDTVTISAGAKAVQEATETQAQTAHEASSGDAQARSLLARELAAKASAK